MAKKLGADWISATINLAIFYTTTNKLDQADSLLRNVLKRKGGNGPSEQGTAAAQVLLGRNLLKQGRDAEAEPLLREAVAIYDKGRPNFWMRYNALSVLGGALLGQRRFTEAEPLLLEGCEGFKKGGALALFESEAIERLVQLYEATDQAEKANTWRKKLTDNKLAVK